MKESEREIEKEQESEKKGEKGQGKKNVQRTNHLFSLEFFFPCST